MTESARSATTATILGAFALVRIILAIVAIGGFTAAMFAEDATTPLLLTAVGLGLIPLVHGIITFRRVRAKPDAAHIATAVTVVMDAVLAVSVLGAIDTSSTPLAWLALMFPVVETAVLFSLVPAAVVWFGVSLAFLAVQLMLKSEGDSDAFRLAFQQLMAVFLLSGPASLLSDSSQRRVQQLDQAKQDADEISDQLRRVSWAASEMSQAKDPDAVLDVALTSALSMGFDQADVVVRTGPVPWRIAQSNSIGAQQSPPAELLASDALDRLTPISPHDTNANQTLRSMGLAAGWAVQVTTPDRDAQIVMRIWSRGERNETDVRALELLGEQTRELHRIALLLGDARRHAAQLEHETRHDGLTGLANRNWVRECLDNRLAAGERSAVFFIDLDGFKGINDTLGHSAGDDALQIVGERLRTITHADDLVGRMGGDEFIIIVNGDRVGDTDELVATGMRYVDAIREPLVADGHPAQLGASIGLAVQSDHNLDTDHLITAADTAMYEAKREGGGVRVALDQPETIARAA